MDTKIIASALQTTTSQDTDVPSNITVLAAQVQNVSEKLKDAAQGLESLRSMLNNSNS